jgi:hypothetical protein
LEGEALSDIKRWRFEKLENQDLISLAGRAQGQANKSGQVLFPTWHYIKRRRDKLKIKNWKSGSFGYRPGLQARNSLFMR